MRLFSALGLGVLVFALPAMFRQELDAIPTFQMNGLTVAQGITAQRGGNVGTFTRASTAYRLNQTTGFYDSITSGTADVGYPIAVGSPLPQAAVFPGAIHTLPGLAAKNRAADSFTGVAWVDDGGVPVRTGNAAVGVSGSTDASKIDDQNAGAVVGIKQVIGVPDDANSYVFSVWVSCDTTKSVEMDISYTGGGTPVGKAGHTHTCTSGSKTKFTESLSNNGLGNTTANIFIYPAAANAADTGYAYFSRAEFYVSAGGIVYNFDPLVGAGADFVQVASSTSWASLTPADTGTFCEWIWYQKTTTVSNTLMRWVNGAVTHDMQVTIGGTGNQVVFDITTGTTNANYITTATLTQRAWTHVCVEWAQPSSTFTFYFNGVNQVGGSGTSTWTAGTDYGSTLEIGPAALSEGSQGELFFHDATYWANRNLSGAKVMQIYRRQKAAYGY